jgi:HEAT repeat protein
MGGNFARTVIGSFAWLAVVATTAGAEPSWGSKPLSHWIVVLQAGDQSARTDAARALTQIALAHGSGAIDPAVPHLIDALRADAPALRLSAMSALEQAGSRALAAQAVLVDLFERDPDADVRAHAGLALTRIAPANAVVVDACGRVLGGDADARVRQAAAAALVQAGTSARPVEAAVHHALADSDAIVRLFAAGIVGQLGQPGAALPVLLAGLSDDDPGVRVEAAGLLAIVGSTHDDVLAPLIDALRDREPQVRLAAADALGQIGEGAQPALQPLWRLIRDPDERVREGALRAIRKIRG